MNLENDGPISPSEEKVHELVAEFHRLEDQGKAVSPQDFMARHPEHAEALKSYFDGIDAVDQISSPASGTEQTFISSDTRAAADDQTMIEDSASIAANTKVSADAPPTQFGRYRILSELGRGAMGAVYLAQDEQLDRKVALKIPQFGGAMNKGLMERFYREARAAGNLRHPGICPVYDVGEIDGQHFITMAFIEGRPLRDFSKSSKRQADKQTARVIRKIAMAMAEAHDQNVIHRDLKPANIMIDKKNEPVVMDFGLARRAAENEEKLTHTGTVIGTPAYMSPEQVDGDNENVGPPADIYSLGVIFYELLTGELPFQGNLMSILKQISMKQPRPPVELHADTDPFLQDLCLKMLEKDAKDRPESMHEVAKSLSEWLQGLHAPTDESGMLETSRMPGRSKNKEADTVEATDPMTTPGLPRAEPEPEEFPEVSDPEPVSVTELSATTVTPGRPSVAADQPPSNNRKLLMMAGLGGAALLLAGITFFFTLGGKYDVKITVDDPSISLKVDGEDVVIDGSGSPIRLSAGPHTMKMERDGLEAQLEAFTVKKDGKNAVHVAVVNGRLSITKASPRSSDVDDAPLVAGADPAPVEDLALSFDGVDDWVQLPYELRDAFDPIQPYTIELDVTPRPSYADVKGPILALGAAKLEIGSENQGSQYKVVRGKRHIPAGRVRAGSNVRLAAVWDGKEFRSFAAGHRIHSISLVSEEITGTYQSALLGRFGPDFFNGTLNEIRISKVARYDADYEVHPRLESDKHTLALYHCDEGQGDVLKDSSGNNHHGRIVGAKWVRMVSEPPRGVTNLALESTGGESGKERIGKLPVEVPLGEPFTVEVVVRLHSFAGGGYHPIVRLGKICQLAFYDDVLNWSRDCEPETPFKDRDQVLLKGFELNRTAQLAAVYTTEELRFFIDGVLIGTRELADPLPTETVPVELGLIDGTIDELRFSRGARYQTDYQPRERLVPDRDTLALYHFDEGEGEVLKDSSGNDHHGKIGGAKWVRAEAVANTPPPAVAPFDATAAKAHQEAWAKHLGEPVEFTNKLGMTFVLIPPGEFNMGLDPNSIDDAMEKLIFKYHPDPQHGRPRFDTAVKNASPSHRVRITKPFYMQKNEVTLEQYREIIGSVPPENSWRLSRNVRLQDAVAFCNGLSSSEGRTPAFVNEDGLPVRRLDADGYRLPTEAEWEFACRAGTETMWFFGSDPNGPDFHAVNLTATQTDTAKDKARPNPFGLIDLYGGSIEWCFDQYKPYTAGLAVDPFTQVGKGNAVLRGGSGADDGGRSVEVINSFARVECAPDDVRQWVGVGRLVLPIDTAKLVSAQTTRNWDTPEFQKWVAQVAGLSAEKQVEAVARKLQELNPGFDGVVTHEIQNGIVTRLEFLTDSVTDISPVRALAGLTRLHANGSKGRNGKLIDLSPLQGLQLDFLAIDNNPVTDLSPLHDVPLKNLEMHFTQVADLSPLRGKELGYLVCAESKITDLSPLTGMPLRRLQIEGTQVSSLSHLKGMPLELLFCSGLNINDLSPLQGMPLTQLRLFNTQVTDLSPLKGMPLRILETAKSKVTDLSPLRELPLEELICDFSAERDTATLRSIRTLKTINGKPVAEFWKEVEGNDTGKAPPPAKAPLNEAQAKAHQKAWADHLGLPAEKEVELAGGAKIAFMLIPPGKFLMGSSQEEQNLIAQQFTAAGEGNSYIERLSSEGPQHRVRITKPFYLARHELTEAQWQAVTGKASPDNAEPEVPVSKIVWDDVQQFLNALHEHAPANEFLLPTEAQWEYACRAGSTTNWYSGNNEEALREFAWVLGNSGKTTHPVAQLNPNPFGLYDMHGNVWEVCSDKHSDDYYSNSPVDDPTGPSTGLRLVFRGGTSKMPAKACRSAYRQSYHPNGGTGIRVAMTIDLTKTGLAAPDSNSASKQ